MSKYYVGLFGFDGAHSDSKAQKAVRYVVNKARYGKDYDDVMNGTYKKKKK